MCDERYAASHGFERENQLASLTRRLRDGEARIQTALALGEDVTAWEDFWLRLLHEYESIHDRSLRDSTDEHSRIAA